MNKNKIILSAVYYKNNIDNNNYFDIVLKTNLGFLKYAYAELKYCKDFSIEGFNEYFEINSLNLLNNPFVINQVRFSYDGCCFLISDEFVFAIEYEFNSDLLTSQHVLNLYNFSYLNQKGCHFNIEDMNLVPLENMFR